jgi:hypothetical protein
VKHKVEKLSKRLARDDRGVFFPVKGNLTHVLKKSQFFVFSSLVRDGRTEQNMLDPEGEIVELYVAEESRISVDYRFRLLSVLHESGGSLRRMIRWTAELSAQDQAT